MVVVRQCGQWHDAEGEIVGRNRSRRNELIPGKQAQIGSVTWRNRTEGNEQYIPNRAEVQWLRDGGATTWRWCGCVVSGATPIWDL